MLLECGKHPRRIDRVPQISRGQRPAGVPELFELLRGPNHRREPRQIDEEQQRHPAVPVPYRVERENYVNKNEGPVDGGRFPEKGQRQSEPSGAAGKAAQAFPQPERAAEQEPAAP